jgi:hypothetical protein
MSNIIAGDVAKYAVDGRSLNPMGEMFRAAVDRKPADAPMALASYSPQKLQNKSQSRMAMTEPRGPATTGTYFAPQTRPTYAAGNYFPPSTPAAGPAVAAAPMKTPMLGLGPSWPGPYSPAAQNEGFDAYKRRLGDMTMANYNRGLFNGDIADAETLGTDYDSPSDA